MASMNDCCDFCLIEKKIIPILFGIQLERSFNLHQISNHNSIVSLIIVSKVAQTNRKAIKQIKMNKLNLLLRFLKNSRIRSFHLSNYYFL